MTIINLKKYYYPLVKTDVFVEVPDEIADALPPTPGGKQPQKQDVLSQGVFLP